MMRDGTCIDDVHELGGWVSTCGHGASWRLGDTKAACTECVGAVCAHPKAGVDFEQGRLV